MKQLPGRSWIGSRWLRVLVGGCITAVATVWMLSLLPFLLLFALIFAVLLIPVTRRLKREMEDAGFDPNNVDGWRAAGPPSTGRTAVDVTPWYRQVMNGLSQRRNNSSTMSR